MKITFMALAGALAFRRKRNENRVGAEHSRMVESDPEGHPLRGAGAGRRYCLRSSQHRWDGVGVLAKLPNVEGHGNCEDEKARREQEKRT